MDLFEIADEMLYHSGKSVDSLQVIERYPELSDSELGRVMYLIDVANVNVSWQDNV